MKILFPVGTAVIIVADVKYAHVSTVNMWCVHITNPNSSIATTKIIPRYPNAPFLPIS